MLYEVITNRLAVELAAAVGGTPVITTATDVNGLTAWDEAARQAGLRVEPLAHINRITSYSIHYTKLYD